MPPKKRTLTKDIALRWIEFSIVYWQLLDKEQRDAYLLDLLEGIEPPTITLDDMSSLQIAAMRQHQGLVIQKYRKRAGMTLEDMAALLNKKKSYLSLIESGARTLTVTNIYRLMEVLDIPANEMFKVEPVPSPNA